MASRDDIFRFLSGGITALIPDGGDGAKPLQGTEASPAARPEQTAPQIINQESFLNQVVKPPVLIGVGILIAAIAALSFARR